MSLAADMLAYRNLIESLTKQSKRVINSIFGVEKLFCLGKSKTSPVIYPPQPNVVQFRVDQLEFDRDGEERRVGCN